MATRRIFLQRSLLVTSALACGALRTASAASQQTFTGIIHTPSNPGKWSEKVGSHAPQISIDGRQVTVTTPHPMSQDHYIVRHTLVLKGGTVTGAKTFFPVKDTKAVSSFTLPEGYKEQFYVTSFCNLHDLWIAEAKL